MPFASDSSPGPRLPIAIRFSPLPLGQSSSAHSLPFPLDFLPRRGLRVLLLLCILAAGFARAQAQPPRFPPPPGNRGAGEIVLQVFAQEGSKVCEKGLAYVEQLKQQHPGLRVQVFDVVKSPAARRRLDELTRRFRYDRPGVPSFYVYDQFLRGFTSAEQSGPKIREMLTAHVYVRTGCPHCAAAKEYLSRLQTRYPALRIVYHNVNDEPGARNRVEELSRQFGIQAPGLPTFHLCGRLVVGFIDRESSGRQIEALLDKAAHPPVPDDNERSGLFHPATRAEMANVYVLAGVADFDELPPVEETSDFDELPPAEPVPRGEPLPEVADDTFEPLPPLEELPDSAPDSESVSEGLSSQPPPEVVHLPLFGPVRVREWGLPAFTIAVGLIDGFNPCAMWVLILLLSLLVNLKDRRKIALIAGTFVLISGLAYFAFMAAWLNVFLLIGYDRYAEIILGVLALTIGLVNIKDFFAFGQGVSLKIPESMKPAIYNRMRNILQSNSLLAALAGAIVLAVLVNTIELLCTAGLPAVYTRVLVSHNLPTWEYYGYLALYNVAYMFDDSIMVGIAVATLSNRRLQEREGRWLKLVSGIVILALGLLLLFQPGWLK